MQPFAGILPESGVGLQGRPILTITGESEEQLFPPKTGKIMRMNDFGSEYIVTESASGENDTSKIEMVQPEIRYEAFLSSYLAALDMCLQGIVSPRCV